MCSISLKYLWAQKHLTLLLPAKLQSTPECLCLIKTSGWDMSRDSAGNLLPTFSIIGIIFSTDGPLKKFKV